MTNIKSNIDRRNFLKVSAAAGGGLVIGFTWGACNSPSDVLVMPSEWVDINAFLKIGDNGIVTIFSPNPEIGQNVKTSMPMIIAEELGVAWKNVIVKQAPLNTDSFTRQVAGGSQSIRQSWNSLRMAGATAKQLLVNAASKKWDVDPITCSVFEGTISDKKGNKVGFGEIASEAAGLEMPTDIKLKDPSEFTIIGQGKGNVDIDEIITGKPLFGLDYTVEGMKYSAVLRPPAFGNTLDSYNDRAALAVNGVEEVVRIGDKVAVIANSTWAAFKGKNALTAKWNTDGQLESTDYHDQTLRSLLDKKAEEPRREDGNVRKAFSDADQVVERVFEAPFLPHNCMAPMNFFANVTDDKVELVGPIQTPQRTRSVIASELNRDEEQVTIDMCRMGGGFGRRLYGDFALEAALISDKIRKPVQLIYSREDDMTAGIYRPASKYKFRAAIKNNKMVGYHLVGAGINMRNATRQNNFPASAVDNYLVESHNLQSNITTGAWRAPITNFLAYAEQAFLDEVAEACGKDAVEFRLQLFERAKNNPVGEPGYDADKSIEVIKLAKDKSNWGNAAQGVYQGFSTYYSHNTYVAEVADMIMQDGNPVVKKVTVAIDCGIVVNPLGAINQVEGGVVDGIGHAMYGDFAFENGKPQSRNFDKYRLIRMKEAPKEINVYFVKSNNDPTGLGEPSLPPAGGAIANAFYKATGQRLYKQPFVQSILLG